MFDYNLKTMETTMDSLKAAFVENIGGMISTWGLKLLGGIVAFIIGLWIINRLVSVVGKMMEKRGMDESLQPFIKSLMGIGLKAMLLISVAGMVGIETTSFVAVIGAAGLAVGLALQGTLANFAGGVLILIFKPYKVGDLIEAQGHVGWVEEIQIFVTILKTPDTRTVIIPNGAMSNGDITNNSKLGKMRVNLVMGISYESSIKQAREVLLKVMNDHPKVMQDPAPSVGVLELGDSSVNLAVHPHCKAEDYWDVYFGTIEKCKLALDAAGIEIPYPHSVEIHKDA